MAHSGDKYLYSTGRSYVDLAADETGLWAIHAATAAAAADDDDQDRVLVSRLDTVTMTVTSTWSIAVRHADYGNGFVVCGVLYLVGDVTSPHSTPIDFAYDLYERRRVDNSHGSDGSPPTFSSPYQLTTALTYNPRDRRLYAWDNGNQLTYPLLV